MRHILTTCAATLCLAGCAATPSHPDLSAFLKAHEHEVSATEVRIAAGDILRIEAPRIHEIAESRVRVEPDGKIAFRLAGEVKVAGLTPREAATKLREHFSPFYRNPEIYVRIVEQPSLVYYVLGQVRAAGMYRYTGRDTLVDALVRAQLNELAEWNRITVTRPSPNNQERHVIEVNVNKMMKEGDTRLNILLEPGDVVYVPPTPLAWVGLKLRELLYPVAPAFDAYVTPLDFELANDDYNKDTSNGGRRRRSGLR